MTVPFCAARKLAEPRMRRNMPRLTHIPVYLILPAVLTLAYVGTMVEFPLDFWHQVTNRRLIWQSGAIPTKDTFTFTIAAQPIINQCWLAQLGMYGLFRAGGFALVQFVAAACYGAAIGLTTLTAWRRSQNARVSAALGVAAIFVSLSNFGVRPQALSFLLFAVELFVLWNWPDRWLTPIVAAAVVALWSNAHGAFPLGVMLPGLFLAADVWTRLREAGVAGMFGSRTVRCFALCLLVTAAAAFCNPHPDRTLDYLFGVSSRAARRGIEEWQPCGLNTYAGIAFFISATAVAIIVVPRRKEIKPLEWILLVVFALVALPSQRMVAWWALVLPPVLARHVVPSSKPANDASFTKTAILAVLIVWAAMTTPWTRAYNPLLPAVKRQLHADDEPAAVVEFLRGKDGRVFAPVEWGAYLTWRLDPRIKVFIDARVDFFPDPVWRDFLRIGTAAEGWQAALDRYEVQMVVWPQGPNMLLSTALGRASGWRKIYQDGIAVVFVRTSPIARSAKPIGIIWPAGIAL